MARVKYIGGITAICGTILISAGLLAQDTKPARPTPEQMQEMQEKMEQAWMRYMTPGEEHKQLAKRAGQWNFQGKMWEYPGTPVQEFDGTSTIKSVMGGRYLFEEVKSEVMGEEFLGFGIGGFDNLTKQYVGTWLDNMGTGIIRMKGTASEDGKVINYTGEHPDLMEGRYKTVRSVETITDDDNFVIVMYNTTPDGQEFMMMEMTYTRTK